MTNKHLNDALNHRTCMYEIFKKEYDILLLGAIQKDQEEIIVSLVDKGLGVDTIIESGKKLEYLRLEEAKIDKEIKNKEIIL